ncbi:hypothetical protein AB6A40_002735 [Gnathostoma spinigerum]|uniref:Carbohydrate kinase PfkB domain-containing protein n=1 Tax=Gnathostoma spinigerum TaxID=75299 RepID=A0ABD6E8T3_9BILA
MPDVKVVDSTGVEDSFCGVLVYFLVKKAELPLVEKVRQSIETASFSVQYKGAQPPYPWAKSLRPELFQ